MNSQRKDVFACERSMATLEYPKIVFDAKRGYKTKVKRFEPFWKRQYEKKALKMIEKYTGLRWKKATNRIEVVARQPNNYERTFSALTDIPKRPCNICLFDINSNESTSKDLIHELIHSIMWSTYLGDHRMKQIGFFEDIFADELLTELISQKTCIKMGLSKRIDYREALQYGFETALEKIADILGVKTDPWKLSKDGRRSTIAAKTLRKDMLRKLGNWFKTYLRNVQAGNTNSLRAVEEIAGLFSNISEHK